MSRSTSGYFSYLLRLWRVCDEDSTTWRSMLEDPHSGERRGFATPMLMFRFLLDEMESRSKRNDQGGADEWELNDPDDPAV
jgi:hypothetical protein